MLNNIFQKMIWVILAVFLGVSLMTLWQAPLLPDDASIYALIIKNFAIYGQWSAQFITPGDFSSFIDKPLLGIWLMGFIPKLMGISELSVHIPNFVYYLVMLLLAYLVIGRLANKQIAFYTTLVMATSLNLIIFVRTPKLEIIFALFTFMANMALYAYLKKNKVAYMYLLAIILGLGFLVKSGLILVLTGLNIILIMMVHKNSRDQIWGLMKTRHFWGTGLIFLGIVGGVLGWQYGSLENYGAAYLRSLVWESKYNIGYLGLTFNLNAVGFLLLTIFPWTALFLSELRINFKKIYSQNLSLFNFCKLWFLSTFVFFLLFYKQTDLRNFVVLVPPLAIIGGTKIILSQFLKKARPMLVILNNVLLTLFTLAAVLFLLNPANLENIDKFFLKLVLALFILALFSLGNFYKKPLPRKFLLSFITVCVAYTALFYFAPPLIKASNPNLKWPQIIKGYQTQGYKFYIYRPQDRNLYMSTDLSYTDFIAGPADKYFWEKDALLNVLATENKVLVLSESKSWEKLGLNNYQSVAQDQEASIFVLN